MKHFSLITILLVLFLLGCNQIGNTNIAANDSKTLSFENDKELIENLVKHVLKWHEIHAAYIGFEPISSPKDSLYIGMDLDKLKIGLKKLNETNFFDKEFLDNYNKIVLTIDKKLKNKELKWYVGEMPPFGGANPWCKCQDYPYDNPWEKVEFKFVLLDKENVILTWTWGDSEWSKDFNYKVKAKKANGTWKISYLQGFDISEFIPGLK